MCYRAWRGCGGRTTARSCRPPTAGVTDMETPHDVVLEGAVSGLVGVDGVLQRGVAGGEAGGVAALREGRGRGVLGPNRVQSLAACAVQAGRLCRHLRCRAARCQDQRQCQQRHHPRLQHRPGHGAALSYHGLQNKMARARCAELIWRLGPGRVRPTRRSQSAVTKTLFLRQLHTVAAPTAATYKLDDTVGRAPGGLHRGAGGRGGAAARAAAAPSVDRQGPLVVESTAGQGLRPSSSPINHHLPLIRLAVRVWRRGNLAAGGGRGRRPHRGSAGRRHARQSV